MRNEIKILKVVTNKQKRDFVNFPNSLYKDNCCYVPKFTFDELKIFKKNYCYNENCESVFFNAYCDGKIVGRIQGILQRVSNKIRNEKRVRFTRFDVIDDFNVTKLLFAAIEDWALGYGMDAICGPLSYSDIEPEGVLVEGFDQVSTFFETFNAPYYTNHLEQLGFSKEVDWLEHKVYLPDDSSFDIDNLLSYLLKQSNFSVVQYPTAREFIDNHAHSFFKILDCSYQDLYQTVPIPEKVISSKKFELKCILNGRYVGVIEDNKKPVAIGLAFPSIVKVAQKSKGHLYPSTILEIYKNVRNPTGLELGLIGVMPEYRNTEAGAIILLKLMQNMKKDNILFAETNLNLESNKEILSQWNNFNAIQHKRRRCYFKKIK